LTTLTKKQNKGQIHDFYYEKHFCVNLLFRWKQYSGNTYSAEFLSLNCMVDG